jgi:ABC-2 type transport system permease protein
MKASMNRTRIAAVVLRIFYLYRGSPQRVFPIFVWVVVDILLWGFLTRYLNSVARAEVNFIAALLGAVLLWDFLTRVMQGVTMAFFEDVWSRNFLNYFATPLRMSEYLAGLILAAVSSSMISLIVMVTFARVAFGLSFLSYGLALAPFLAVLFLTGIALGVAAAALGLRLGPASEWLIWPIPTLVSPFAGVFYPLAILPGWMQAIAALLPPSYVFEGMRAIVAGEPAPWDRLVLGGGLAMAYLLLACLFFMSVYRTAIRTGLIARYSAETLS